MPSVEFIPLSLVDDYAKNSNTHPQDQINNIKALMLYVGWTVPALVRKTGERYGLIAGHGRRDAANELQGNMSLLITRFHVSQFLTNQFLPKS